MALILIIRVDYDQMDKASRVFASESENVKRSIDSLKGVIEVLEGGDWIGEGANAFYREMHSQVMPALKRLMEALASAGRVTLEIKRIFEETEEDNSTVFSQFLSSIGDAGAADFRRAGEIAMGERAGLGAMAGAAAGGGGGGGGAGGSEPEQAPSGGGGGGAGGGAGGGGGGGGGGGSWDGEIGFKQETPAPGGSPKPPARPRRR